MHASMYACLIALLHHCCFSHLLAQPVLHASCMHTCSAVCPPSITTIPFGVAHACAWRADPRCGCTASRHVTKDARLGRACPAKVRQMRANTATRSKFTWSHAYVDVHVCMHISCIHIHIFIYAHTCVYTGIQLYACMYACMEACMHVCMHACMHACMYVCLFVCMYACMDSCMYECMYLSVCTCLCMRVCMHVCMCVYVLVHVFLSVYTCINMQTVCM